MTHGAAAHLKSGTLQPSAGHRIQGEHAMNMLYDSDSFVVVHMQPVADLGTAEDGSQQPQLARHGFEIVDKRSGKEVYLDGSWAEMFQQQILAWQRNAPTEQEVEDTLDGYVGLAQNPVVIH